MAQDLNIYFKFLKATKVKKIIGIVERLRLPARHCFAQALAGGRSSKRLTVNVMRNQPAISLAVQQRNRRTLDETNIPSPQAMYMILLNSSVCPGRDGPGRQSLASFTRYLIFLLLCVFVLFTWSNCSPKGGSSQSVVIRVGDRTITLGDLERIVDITSLENGIPKGTVWLSINSLVDRIVDDSLILGYGKEQGISVPEIELERAIQDIVKDYPDNSFKETLLSRCIDYSEWKQRFREQLLIEKIIREQTGSLPPISHQAITAYYEERKEEFRHPPRVKLLHIITKERKEAEDLYARLKGEEDMAQLLEEQSADSALQGDYGTEWRTSGMFPPALSHRAFSMEVGKTSTIIETQYGFHIIKVLKREPAGRKGFLEVVAEIEKRLVSEATEQRYRVWLQELRDTYHTKVDYPLLDKKKAEYAGS